jgi:multidrug efflux pump subunit AcrA (membrane-fusion protein)
MNIFFRTIYLAMIGFMVCAALQAEEQLYTCGMHPQIIKKEPGNCPICGMALVPVRSNTAGSVGTGERHIKFYKSSMNPGEVSAKPGKDSMGMDLIPVYGEAEEAEGAIHIDSVTVQRMNLKTGLVTLGPVLRELRTVGSIAYDESGLRDVTVKYDGWVEKLYVNRTWTVVKAGDPLFEIYSPDLYNAELNYTVALRSEGTPGGPMTRASLSRLQLFDVPDSYIAEIAKTGAAPRTYVYRAQTDGTVIEKMAVAGQMVKSGERVYQLANLSSVWVLAQVYEQDLPFVRQGQSATVRVTYGPERLIEGRVDTLLPQVEEQTRTATARIVLPNPDGSLRPGMFVDVRFVAKLSDSSVLVPDMAVLRSGERNTVFIAHDDGSFEPREIKLGVRSQGNFYEVLAGLHAGERVVVSGQFMLDSESQLRDSIQKMLKATVPASRPAALVASEDQDHPSVVGMDDAAALPEAAKSRLQDLADTTVEAAQALAADDLAQYQKILPGMRHALDEFLKSYAYASHGSLEKFRDALPDHNDLKAMRRDFAYFSTAVADLVRDNHLNHAAGLHIFQCPMAPGIGTGRWLQRSSVLKNPFYGSTMLDCGEEVDAPAAPPSASSWEAPEGNRDAPSSLGRPAFATRQGVLS